MPSVPSEVSKKKWIDPRAKEVHCPVAHARPLDPQLFPFGAKISAGHADEFPGHISGISQAGSLAGRQTCVAGANWHCAVQHGVLLGSHTEFWVNLHVWESQQVELTPLPGSQSSPLSTMPLPHIWSVMVCRLGSGFRRQLVSTCPLAELSISEPRRVSSKGGVTEMRIRLRTDVPD
jgi:hypothetical protein